MFWFKEVLENIDNDILTVCEAIEIDLMIIDEKFKDFKPVFEEYYEHNTKTKEYYEIHKVEELFNRIKASYDECYSKNTKKEHTDFSASTETQAQKLEIMAELRRIQKLCELILEHVHENLQLTKLKKVNLTVLCDELEELFKLETRYRELEENERDKLQRIVNLILEEVIDNRKKKRMIRDGIGKKKGLDFSNTLPYDDVKELELIPIFELKGLVKRSHIICNYHSDKTLPIKHYNLEIDRTNIHVIPCERKDELEELIIVA